MLVTPRVRRAYNRCMATNRSAAPLIAALILVLVLVPVLYVALYYCLVVPQGQTAIRTVRAGNQSMVIPWPAVGLVWWTASPMRAAPRAT